MNNAQIEASIEANTVATRYQMPKHGSADWYMAKMRFHSGILMKLKIVRIPPAYLTKKRAG